jgi:hypothetical protein
MSASQRILIEIDNPPQKDIQFDAETNERLTGWHKSDDRTVELYVERKFSDGVQRAIIDLIERSTYGAYPKKKRIPLPTTWLADLFKKSREQIATVLKDAEDRGLVDAVQPGGPGHVKFYRLTKWDEVKPYTPPKPSSGPKPLQTAFNFRSVVNIMPSRNSAWEEWPLTDEDRERGTIRVKVYNHWNRRCTQEVLRQEDGLHVHFHDDLLPEDEAEGEDGANGVPRILLGGSGPEQPPPPPRKKQKFRPLPRPRLYPPSAPPPDGSEPTSLPPDSPDDLKRFRLRADYREFLERVLLDHWGKALDKTFLDTIVSKANGAPVEVFAAMVQARLVGNHKHRTGLLVYLAGDAAESHQAIKAREESQPAKPQMTEAEYAAWRSSLSDEERAELDAKDRQYDELVNGAAVEPKR